MSASDEAIILSGQVSSNTVVLRAGEIAQASATKAKVINMLQLPGGSESQQVILQVRFAEVNRRALTELGANLLLNRPGEVGRSTTQQFAAPGFDNGQNASDPQNMVFSDFLNLFFFSRSQGVGAVIKALKSHGFFQSLAEPNLIAYNNEEASFLAGGEIPVPVVQGATGTVTVRSKEFGIRLTFKPTIAGDVIRLKVRPEVSTLDFANGITLSGFRIPALSVRRADTDVELRDGQSFVVAGLLDNLTQENGAEIPLLSKLPIIGNLFKSKADSTERTELMVLITPRLVQALDPDEVPPLPTRPKRFLSPAAAELVNRWKAVPASSTRPIAKRTARTRSRQRSRTGEDAHAVTCTLRFGTWCGVRPGGHRHVRPRRVQHVRAGLRRDVGRAESGAGGR